MTNIKPNNSYCDTTSFDPLFDFDELFSSTFNFISNDEYDPQSIIIKEEYDDTSPSNEMDQEQLQTISIDDSSQLYNLPDLICGVCGAPAVGCNFDKITCESCKAFFRRNAFRDMTTMKCRFLGSCIINMQTRRQCTYCRLKKCFDIKMRKDWIRTEDEKELRQLQKVAKEQKKLNKLADEQEYLLNLPIVVRKKRHLRMKPTTQELVVKPIFAQTYFGYNRNLCDHDRIIINNITNCYQLATSRVNTSCLNHRTSPQSLAQFINEENSVHESLISFYRSVPHFNELDISDRVLLIKWNLVKIVHLHRLLMRQFQENSPTGDHMSKWISPDFDNQMSRTYRSFHRFMDHPLVLKLALIVLIFSTNLSVPDNINSSDDYKNQSQISAIQDFYTTILWNYLNSVYDEREAIRSIEIIMTQILHFQVLMTILEESLQREKVHCPVNELESCIFRVK